MAYGLKYELTGKSTLWEDTYNLLISFDGYSGSEIDRNVPVNPFRLRKDAAEVIVGSSLDFGIIAETDFELIEFYTSNPRGIFTELKKNGTSIWTGFVIPELYKEAYSPAPLAVWFTASDGLASLKDVPYTLTGFKSELEILIHCIDNLDLSMGYAIAIGIHEKTSATNRAVLAQTYVDATIYDEWNCYDVIEDVLKKYTATITQHNGRWLIQRLNNHETGRMYYTTAGVYESTSAAPSVLALGEYGASGTDIWTVGSLSLEMQPAGKGVKITHPYGLRDSYLKNYNFEDSDLSDWTAVGINFLEQRKYNDVYYAYIGGYASAATSYIKQAVYVDADSSSSFIFSCKVAAFGYAYSTGLGAAYTLLTATFKVILSDGTNAYYLSENGWVDTNSVMSFEINSSMGHPTWTDIKIYTDGIPISGTITVVLYKLVATSGQSGIRFGGIAFTDVFVANLFNDEVYPEGREMSVDFGSAALLALPDIELNSGDAPDLPNNKVAYNNVLKLSTGAVTELWKIDGDSVESTLMGILARTLASNNRQASEKLYGQLRGEDLDFDAVIQHSYNSNRKFYIKEATFNLCDDTMDATLIELLDYVEQTITGGDGPLISISSNIDNPVDSAGHSAYTITVTANTNWTASLQDTGDGTSWITLGTATSTTQSVTVAANTGNMRAARVRITSDDDATVYKELTITQAEAVSLDASPTIWQPEGASDTTTITVTADSGLAWTAAKATAASWLTITSGSGTGDGSFDLGVSANTTGSSRSVMVTVSATGASDIDIYVTQDTQHTISAATDPAVLGYADGSQTTSAITVSPASMATTLTKTDTGDGTSWLKMIGGSANVGNFTLTVEALGDNGTSARSMDITISDDSGAATDITVTINQIAGP